MIARVKNIFGRWIRNKKCPKALGVYNPSDPVSFLPWRISNPSFREYMS
jgi:hypothetical protein